MCEHSFFFSSRRRHTRFKCDWSSDVCSSDLDLDADRERKRLMGHSISVEVNGQAYEREVEARRLLVHFLRDDLELTGTHVGCDTGNCGACTVRLDGRPIKSCMMLAVHPDRTNIQPLHGLSAA